MKLLSLPAFLVIILLSSCSKKNTPAPVTNTGSIVINGSTYPTIIIGAQTWTSLNYLGGTGSLATADPTYGNFYTLTQAMAITLPAGWRIPTRTDYNNLLSNFTTTKNSSGDYVGSISVARALADTAHFHSLASLDLTMLPTNSSGFSAYPGGEYDVTNKVVDDQYYDGTFLTSTTGTVNSTPVIYFFGITSDGVNIGSTSNGYYAGLDFNYSPFAYSLRFVKDN